MKFLRTTLLAGVFLALIGYAYWKYAIPVHHVEVQSELFMLGDLDGDHHWTQADLARLQAIQADPYAATDDEIWKLDLNQNGRIDGEDVSLLRALVAAGGDPYAAEEQARQAGVAFPRPREFYRYLTLSEYRVRPVWTLPTPQAKDSVLTWLKDLQPSASGATYADNLEAAIYDEALRFDHAWRRRAGSLLPVEQAYADLKLGRLQRLRQAGERQELLLGLIELTEDAETLTARNQPPITLQVLAFRDHLRGLLASPEYQSYHDGSDWHPLLSTVSGYLQTDLGLSYDLATLGLPRSLTHLENYVERAEWQYYKSSRRETDFLQLIAYAQHDPRYLRAAARTTRKLQDLGVENHNLPMVLLYREALRICAGDKRRAAGLLDESIRRPFQWVKSIPREKLPSALAFDNFLLPGNKEDGADKSRHWNVFGGICLYKTPQEAIDLALKREIQDLREGHYSAQEMREFFRDLIGDLNGIYHVMSVNPRLLAAK
jgi:hypothetical protein